MAWRGASRNLPGQEWRSLRRLICNPRGRAALIDYLTASEGLKVLETAGPLWVRHDLGNEAVNRAATDRLGLMKRMMTYAREAGLWHFNPHQTPHTSRPLSRSRTGIPFPERVANFVATPCSSSHIFVHLETPRINELSEESCKVSVSVG